MRLDIPGLPIVHEDETLVVVDKPSGMLSQPGRTVFDSVVTRVQQARPESTGPMLVHRLDMDTSGLLLLAKTRNAHRTLQQQFEHRRIGKRYIARLVRPPAAMGGRIHLPLRLDIANRPHQIVCHVHGKSSTTLWHRCSLDDPHRICLYPLTGRTHQLRVHMAHPAGLGTAIRGDRLYSSCGDTGAGLSGDILAEIRSSSPENDAHDAHHDASACQEMNSESHREIQRGTNYESCVVENELTGETGGSVDERFTPTGYSGSRLELHAEHLSFDHPQSGERVRLYSAPPFIA